MRIALIGNSHAAMLIAAHRQDPRTETLTVFAKPSLQPGDCVLEGSVLRAVSADLRARLADLGTPERLDLAGYDAVVMAGMLPAAFAALRLAQGHSIAGWPSAAAVMARALQGAPARKDRPLMTRAAYGAALCALTQEALPVTLVAALRQVCDVPVVVVPQPLPSEALMDTPDKYPIFRRLLREGDGAALAQDLEQAHRAGLGTLAGVRCLHQPQDTRRQGILTAADLMRAGPRLSAGTQQGQDDILHGNAALGTQMLALLRETLGLSCA